MNKFTLLKDDSYLSKFGILFSDTIRISCTQKCSVVLKIK
jgi:hypothetical protein